MNPKETNSKQGSITPAIFRFLGGSALGAFVVTIPFSYAVAGDLNTTQIGIASLFVVLCGVLSSLWGEKFINAVMRVLNAFGA